MLYLGIVIGLLIGAAGMYFKNTNDLGGIRGDLSVVRKALEASQDKLKSVKSQLYKRRSTYKKKTNGSNGKKATRKKTATNTKKTNI